MSHRPTLAEFVDQELRLAEALFGGLVDAVLKQWRNDPPSRLASDMDEALCCMDDRRSVRHVDSRSVGDTCYCWG